MEQRDIAKRVTALIGTLNYKFGGRYAESWQRPLRDHVRPLYYWEADEASAISGVATNVAAAHNVVYVSGNAVIDAAVMNALRAIRTDLDRAYGRNTATMLSVHLCPMDGWPRHMRVLVPYRIAIADGPVPGPNARLVKVNNFDFLVSLDALTSTAAHWRERGMRVIVKVPDAKAAATDDNEERYVPVEDLINDLSDPLWEECRVALQDLNKPHLEMRMTNHGDRSVDDVLDCIKRLLAPREVALCTCVYRLNIPADVDECKIRHMRHLTDRLAEHHLRVYKHEADDTTITVLMHRTREYVAPPTRLDVLCTMLAGMAGVVLTASASVELDTLCD